MQPYLVFRRQGSGNFSRDAQIFDKRGLPISSHSCRLDLACAMAVMSTRRLDAASWLTRRGSCASSSLDWHAQEVMAVETSAVVHARICQPCIGTTTQQPLHSCPAAGPFDVTTDTHVVDSREQSSVLGIHHSDEQSCPNRPYSTTSSSKADRPSPTFSTNRCLTLHSAQADSHRAMGRFFRHSTIFFTDNWALDVHNTIY